MTVILLHLALIDLIQQCCFKTFPLLQNVINLSTLKHSSISLHWSFFLYRPYCLHPVTLLLPPNILWRSEYEKKNPHYLSVCLSLALNINAKVIQRLKCQANVSFRDEAIHRNLWVTEQAILPRFHRDFTDALKAL